MAKGCLLAAWIASAGAASTCAVSVLAQTRPTVEFWPEMQFQYRIDEANKLIGMTRLRDNGNNGQPYWAE
jgi:hypothetical protein